MNTSSGKGKLQNGGVWYKLESLGYNKFRIVEPEIAPED